MANKEREELARYLLQHSADDAPHEPLSAAPTLRNQQRHEYFEWMNGTKVGKSVGELMTEIERLQAALAWYADEANYKLQAHPERPKHAIVLVELDNGERARKALGDGER